MTARVAFPWRRMALAAAVLATAAMAAVAAPQYGAHGFDLANRDTTRAAGDDFFLWANGGWVARTPIPADKPGASLRLAISDMTERRLHAILDEAAAGANAVPGDKAGKVGAFYRSFLDSARAEALGAKALAGELGAIRAARTRDDVAAVMGRANADFFGTLFNTYMDVDAKDTKHYVLYVTQGGLGLPDRDYYVESSFAEKKAAYQAYAAKLLALIGWEDPEGSARAVVAFEDSVAAASWTRTQQRDPVATYNPVTMGELAAYAPGFPWARWYRSLGEPLPARVIVAEKTAFPALARVFATTPLPTLRAWLAFTTADAAAPYLSRAFVDAHFELRGRTLSGQQQLAARWKRGVRAVAGGDYLAGDRWDRFGNMGWTVGELFSAKYFPPQAKAAIEDLVVHVMAAYRERIQALDWMSPPTRVKALEKLDTYRVKVGYPDKPRDVSALAIRADDLVGNVRRTAAFEWARTLQQLAGPVDVSDWGMTPQTNDAYNGSLRDIVFPAGILQPPVFDADADPAYNYGAAGGIIGHELTHGFDDQGRKFDAAGNLNDWWAPADAKAFEERAARLGKQYDAFEPLPGVHVNGALTMGENIADLGGLTLAIAGYHHALGGKPAPVVDGLTGDQRVMLGWAQAWCGHTRDEALRRQVVSDPHSPRMFRVNGIVRNLDAWYDAFGVHAGDKLYVAPEERVRIW